MQKIAIFGGTFNPIHNGHIHLAKQFALQLGVDKVILIPTCVPPHKQAPDLASAQDRLAMCVLAAAEDLFEVSDIEMKRSGPSYTADTLRELKLTYPDSEFYLITGEDMFLTLERWHKSQTIFDLAVLCAAPRSSDGLEKLREYAGMMQQHGAKTNIQNIEYLPISSTMVRDAVKRGENIAGLVPTLVADYIAENKLYLGQDNE